MASDILIVDDEADICELVAGLLQDEGYATRTARDSDGALNEIKSRRPNLLFLDIWLQGSRLDGLQLLDTVKEQHPDMPVVMGLPLREARELFEREYLLAQINRFGGNISRTAEFVGMERSALHRKLKALGIG